jgi:hypothetical protein
MWNFKKQEPPPPPPPRPKIPGWVNITVPIIFAIVIGLLSIVYNSLAEDIKGKVDNKTLQLMIEKQEIKFNALIETLKAQRQVNIPPQSVQQQAPVDINNMLTRDQVNYYFSLTPEQRASLKKADSRYSILP